MRTRRSTTLGFQPPAVGEEEIAAVAETLRSGWLTTGPRTALLEERLAAYVEAEHVLAVSSGTAAMHLALLALGVGPGDEVITSPITWPATANVIEHCGATPVFCDVREDDLNLDPALLPAAVTERTKAILPVHLAGQPCDLDPIHALGLPVVEDAAHALEAATAAASSAGSPRRPASRSTRRRTSPPVRAGSSRRIATTSPSRSAGCGSRAEARLALRPGHVGLQGESLRRARVDRARSNPLANALHAPWNLVAVAAGKPVLTEKPFASNRAEAQRVAEAADAAGVTVMEGFHYLFHPVTHRALELAGDGTLGDLVHIEARMAMPTPDADDPRWSLELAGGALMDLGCYGLHVMRQFGHPSIVRGHAEERSPGVDAWCDVDLGVPRRCDGSEHKLDGGRRLHVHSANRRHQGRRVGAQLRQTPR